MEEDYAELLIKYERLVDLLDRISEEISYYDSSRNISCEDFYDLKETIWDILKERAG